ncbi:MAG TPA: hypothetical protein VGH26_01805 [Gaiellaceae bacterium]
MCPKLRMMKQTRTDPLLMARGFFSPCWSATTLNDFRGGVQVGGWEPGDGSLPCTEALVLAWMAITLSAK